MSHDVKAGMPTDRNSAPIQVLQVEDTVNQAFNATPANGVAVPSGSEIVMVSTTAACWVIFGTSGITVTAAVNGAILVPGGGVSLKVPEGTTHFAVVRASADDGTISVGKLI
jgi:hypothetical protein